MIHIMDDLRETAQELRDKQEQLVQAGSSRRWASETTGVAHELNNPLNNIGLFIERDRLHRARSARRDRIVNDLQKAMEQAEGDRDHHAPGPSAAPRRSRSRAIDVDEVIERHYHSCRSSCA